MCAWWETVFVAGIEAIPLAGKAYNIVKGMAADDTGNNEESKKQWAEFGFLDLLPWSYTCVAALTVVICGELLKVTLSAAFSAATQ